MTCSGILTPMTTTDPVGAVLLALDDHLNGRTGDGYAMLHTPLSQVRDLRLIATEVEANTRAAVQAARAKGASWAEVGDALGVARQSAWERYGT